jgi:hypothetical protein
VSDVALHWSAEKADAAFGADAAFAIVVVLVVLAVLGVFSLPSSILRWILPKHGLAAPMHWFWQAPVQAAVDQASAQRIP